MTMLFDFPSSTGVRNLQPMIGLGSPLSHSRLDASWPLAHPALGDQREQTSVILRCRQTARELLYPQLPVTPLSALTNDDIIAEILQLLYQLGGIDFSDYKLATIMRRLERRMQVRYIPELYQYLDLLESNREEMLTLHKEMISVTRFFRDLQALELLVEKVIGHWWRHPRCND